jgi:hypothetical protein
VLPHDLALNGSGDLVLSSTAKELFVTCMLNVELARDGLRVERDDLGRGNVERDEGVDGEVVVVLGEQGERVEDGESSKERWL